MVGSVGDPSSTCQIEAVEIGVMLQLRHDPGMGIVVEAANVLCHRIRASSPVWPNGVAEVMRQHGFGEILVDSQARQAARQLRHFQ